MKPQDETKQTSMDAQQQDGIASNQSEEDELYNLLGLERPEKAPEIKEDNTQDQDADKDALTALLGASEEEVDDGEAESQEETKTEASGTEPEEQGQEEQEVALEDRLKEFDSKYAAKEEDQSLRGQLKAMEDNVKLVEHQLTSTDFLGQLPKGGVFEYKGQSIYAMDANALNEYLIELKDNGQELAAGQVQTAYVNAVEAAKKLRNDYEALQEQKRQLADATDYVEWVEVREEITNHLKELTEDDYKKVAAHIDAQATANAAYKAAISTKQGKLQKAVDAMESLGILKRLRDQIQAKEPDKKPTAAPDAHAASKKVKITSTGKQPYKIDEAIKMPQSKFNALSDAEIDELLKESFG